jgi:uncharacterized repeat protein (TIGR01451 family)
MVGGEPVRDHEDKPYENDPTHGIANVQPKAVDIASGVDASGGTAADNPGDYNSVEYFYWDKNDDSDGFSNTEDDWLFLRMRVAADPSHGGQYAYKAYHWDVLLDTDGDIWSEFVVDLNGGGGYHKFGTVGIYYSDTEDYEYDPDTDWIWRAEASGSSNEYTRLVEIDYGPSYPKQYWIEYRLHVTDFKDDEGEQLLGADTEFRLFFSTSASATNPLQKDWMAKYVFATPPNMTVVKNVAEEIVDPGDTIHYTIYFNNTGESYAANVYINDTISQFGKYHSSSFPYTFYDDRNYTWKFDLVPPGNHSLMINVTANKYLPSGTEIENYVHLDYFDEVGTKFPSSEDTVLTIVRAPKYTLTKTVTEDEAYPGDTIHYKIELENTGDGCSYEVWVNDTMPAGTTYVETWPAYYVLDGSDIYWRFTNVCPGKRTIYLNVTASTTLENSDVLTNDVELLYTDANGNYYPKLYASAETTIITPIISITKYTPQDTADPGSTPSPSSSSNPVYSWHFTDVGPGTYTITVKIRVDEGTPDGTVLTNTVVLNYQAGPGIDYPEEEDDEETTVTAPIMTLRKTADVVSADPGDYITYTIYYNNSGTGDAGIVWINDTIPSATTFISSSETVESSSGKTYSFYFEDVSPGTHSFTITVQVDVNTADGTSLTNEATMDWTDANGYGYPSKEDFANVTVTAPIFTLSKNSATTSADPGDYVDYTITYINIGTGNAADVWINDTIPLDMTFDTSDPAPHSFSGNIYTWHFEDVSPGVYTIDITLQVNAGTADETVMVNSVKLEYTDANGHGYTPLTDSWTVTATAPEMTIVKNSNVDDADPEDLIVYTIYFNNTGTGYAGLVWVNDTIPSDTTFVGSSETPDYSSSPDYGWKYIDLAPGYYTITITVRVDVGTADETKLVNNAYLDYTDMNGHGLTSDSDSATVWVTSPEMTIAKNSNVDDADPSDLITYTIYFNNTGTGNAGIVWINDTIPSDTTYESSSKTPDYSSYPDYGWKYTDLAPGDYTLTITVRVKAGTADETKLTNTAYLEYSDSNGNGIDTDSDSAVVWVTAPEMTIVKNSDVNDADPGDYITYTIYYNNTGTGNAGIVWVNDTIPTDTIYITSSETLDYSSNPNYGWKFTDLAPDDYSLTVTVRVKGGTADETKLTNTAYLDYTDANGNGLTSDSDSAVVWVTAPEMTIVKNANVDTADPEDLIIYTIYYNNTGTGTAALVWVNDTLPSQVTYEDSSETPDSFSGNFYSFKFTNVAPGTHSFTIEARVNVGTSDEAKLTNTANLEYTDANGYGLTPASDTAIVWVTAPEMTVVKNANVDTADPEDLIVYTIYYNNTGTGVAALVWVNDTIPADTTYVGSSATLDSTAGGVYSFKFIDVAPGDHSFTVTVRVKVGTADETKLTNTAVMVYTDANGNGYGPQSDTAVVWVTAPEMTVVKNSNVDTADPEDLIVYTIFYNNTGTGVSALVWVNDTIPTDTTYVGSSATLDSFASGVYSFKFTNVAPGPHSFTVTVRVKVGTADETKLTNTAGMVYTDSNGNGYNPQSDTAVVWVTAPEIVVVKNANVDTADPEDLIVYTIYYNNTGTGVAALVWINDTIPTDTTYVGSSATLDSSGGGIFSYKFTNVAPGDHSFTVTVRVKVGTADETKLTNTADMEYTDANGNGYNPQSDTAVVWVTAPEIVVVKNANVDTADPEDLIVYTIYYNNTGTGVAALVWVNDTIPIDTTYVGSSATLDSSGGGVFSYKFTNVAPGDHSFTVTVRVKVGTADETQLVNTADMEYTDSNGNGYLPQTDTAVVWVTAPEITVVKNANVDTADPEDLIVYTIYYNNTGTGVITPAQGWLHWFG